MTDQPALPERLQKVLQLAALLTGQVLDAQIAKQPIPPDQVRALAQAALLLDEHGVPLPSLLMQVLHDVAGAADRGDGEDEENEADRSQSKRLAWMLRPFQGLR